MTGRLRLAGALLLLATSCGSNATATADPGDPPSAPRVFVTNPVEVMFTYNVTGTDESSFPRVYSQCDNHGHRVFVSRHPEEFRVITDPSCPGGTSR